MIILIGQIDSQLIVLIGIVVVVAAVFLVRRYLRYRQRTCPQCNVPMDLLNEEEDDLHLSKGEVVEETIKSVDYDVWLCPKCRRTLKFRYGAFFTKYSKCPKCGAKTKSISTTVTSEPTHTMSGTREVHERCDHCSYSHTYRQSISPLDD